MTLDQWVSLGAFVRDTYGDYGYTLNQSGNGMALVYHSDGSAWHIKSDRYGNVTDLNHSDHCRDCNR